EKAMLYEIIRQKNVLKRGGTVVQETRHFDEARSVTIGMRTKEEENDYRYFPEPDLVPLNVSDWAPHIKETLPELPDAKRERLVKEYGIAIDHAKSIVTEMAMADYYEAVVANTKVNGLNDPRLAAVWIVDVLLGELNYRVMGHRHTLGEDIHYDAIPGELNYYGWMFSVDNMVSILQMVAEGTISDRAAVEVIRAVLDEGGTPAEVVQAKGLGTASDDVVSVAAREAVDQNPAAVEDYRKGQEKALNSLVGHVMKQTRGSADPKVAREAILKVLGEG
ncbi:MAG: Asp-tRNA(Asn)/Glu-tRNA(Gln) amidotransferase GatCAB subunit B, partial [Methanosarcinales archaeon]|nr:Asp-tRNA(Asn)/Glu-tRNA(Gln) amidotransferase GatCAB subunit B [Methanosarcinales archaeon]